MLQSDIIRNERGADVCHRIIETAVENVPGDPSKGSHTAKVYCNRPVVLSISDNAKMCPRCDKQPPIGNVHPRVTNAAGVILTKKELEECGVTGVDPTTISAKVPKKTREAKKAVEAKVKKVNKDELVITVALDTIESADDIAATFIGLASKALDRLPVTNFAESKRLIRLQEKLEGLLKV